MYGAVLVPNDAHLGVLFLNSEGYSSMCGHAVLALGGLRARLRAGASASIRRPRGTGQHPLPVRAGGRLRGVRGRPQSRGPVRFHSVPASCWPQVTCRTLPALLLGTQLITLTVSVAWSPQRNSPHPGFYNQTEGKCLQVYVNILAL